MDRCTDCGYALAIHFRRGTMRAGEYLGCPLHSAGLATVDRWPRVTIRVCRTAGNRYDAAAVNRKDHVLVAWADCCTPDGEILLWDLDTGDQWMGDSREHQNNSRRASPDVIARAREEIEHQVGGRVRIVHTVHARTAQAAHD